RIPLADRVMDAFEDAVQAISRGLGDEPGDSVDTSCADIIAQLQQVAAENQTDESGDDTLRAGLPVYIEQSMSEYDLQHTREALREGARLFVVSAAFPIATFDHCFRELRRLLGQSVEVI